MNSNPLGGVVCLSGLNPMKTFPTMLGKNLKAKKDTQMILMTGDNDTRVYLSDVRASAEKKLKS